MGRASPAGRTAFLTIGANSVTIFGLSPAERARRFAVKAGLEPVAAAPADDPVIEADLAFAWDPAWLAWVKARPGRQVTWRGTPVLTHHTGGSAQGRAEPLSASAHPQAAAQGSERDTRDAATDSTLYNEALRKRQDAYLMPLTADTARAVEKASYDGAYKGVTDILTLYLWRGAAFHLTRWAAAAGMTPNMVSAVGAALCVWTFFLFRSGDYWPGMATALGFMVLDTVDGKLARCTGTSSAIGNVIDHGIDLVHPPFWWWAWGAGLVAWGQPFPPGGLALVVSAIVIGYVVQRLVEGVFMRRFGGMHIHVWERIDSRFRLITARRNPNMVILFFALLLGQPRAGLVAVAWWTGLSCLFHLARLAQAEARRAAGRPVTSWLAEA